MFFVTQNLLLFSLTINFNFKNQDSMEFFNFDCYCSYLYGRFISLFVLQSHYYLYIAYLQLEHPQIWSWLWKTLTNLTVQNLSNYFVWAVFLNVHQNLHEKCLQKCGKKSDCNLTICVTTSRKNQTFSFKQKADFNCQKQQTQNFVLILYHFSYEDDEFSQVIV